MRDEGDGGEGVHVIHDSDRGMIVGARQAGVSILITDRMTNSHVLKNNSSSKQQFCKHKC